MRNISYSSPFLVVICLTLLSKLAIAQSMPTYSFGGGNTGDQLGYSVANAGDINADGFDDIISGARGDDTNGASAGSASIFSGLTGDVLYIHFGDNAGDLFGDAVGCAGDVNGDGFDDVIVGALGTVDALGQSVGSARVFSGQDGTILYTFIGHYAGGTFGFSVGSAGDVNGDGFDDLIVGDQSDGSSAHNGGRVEVYSGLNGSVLFSRTGFSIGAALGTSVAGIDDIDGDGFDDFAFGAIGDDVNGTNSGSVFVYSGGSGNQIYVMSGDSHSDMFGSSISSVGDVNNDGICDFIVGAIGDAANGLPSVGSATVFSGVDGSTLYTFFGDATGDSFGFAVSGGGDTDGDGISDIVVGIPGGGSLPGAGIVKVFSGSDGSLIRVLEGQNAQDIFGRSVGSGGDTNGDGLADIIVGAFLSDEFVLNSGCAYLFLGAVRPFLHYTSVQNASTLSLEWTPTGTDPFALEGTIACGGATPGGLGIAGVSLAPVDFGLFGFGLLIANDPTNLISSGNFGFDFFGKITVPNVSRQSPFLAGSYVFIQFFESFPIPSSSNGLALLIAP